MVRTEVYGHRGMGCSTVLTFSSCPENSLSSFEKCLKAGADGLEFDLFLTDYGEMVVCHGKEPYGFANLNLLLYEDGKLSTFPPDLSIENITVSHSNVVLKAPWTLPGLNSRDAVVEYSKKLSDSEKRDLLQKYLQETKGYKPEQSSDYERLPTLEEVFMKFGSGIKYNLELKGSKEQLSHEVLKLLEKYKHLDVFISSFQWIPPPLDPSSKFYDNSNEKNPSPSPVDLLFPLVGNHLNVPLGLLFDRLESLPSVPRMVEIVKKYKASFVNVPDSFWLTEVPVLGLEERKEMALERFVKEMHANGVKVLTYSTQPFDNLDNVKLYFESRVDRVCPNDVEAFVTFSKSFF
uniref:Glycerophosphoryl diester phosphodiesterase family, putative n=1 Tax=Theileria annulata TaxID=5874 RepID=A0A3B0N405_THEAN